jgi:chaperonin GroES
MAFKPLHDRVLVRRVQSEEKTKGGLIIPDTAKEKPAEGEIVAVGEGARKDSGELIAPSVKAGDRILFGKWSGNRGHAERRRPADHEGKRHPRHHRLSERFRLVRNECAPYVNP